MVAAIRTPDQITDVEVARAAWIYRDEPDPVAKAIALWTPLTVIDFLLDIEETPEREAWRSGPELDRLRKRVRAQVEAYRKYQKPVVLTSRVGDELVRTLAHLCWLHGIPSWDQIVVILQEYPAVLELAETCGYPESLKLAEIVPAMDAAWWKIAKARND